jgi:hypothetical protein
MSYGDLNRCRCGAAVSPPGDGRRFRCTGCGQVYDVHWRNYGTKPVAKLETWEGRKSPQGEFETHAVDWSYSAEDLERIRWGFVPYAMEERWAIGVDGDRLCFYRSSMGLLCYVAHLTPTGVDKVQLLKDLKESPETLKQMIDTILVGRS